MTTKSILVNSLRPTPIAACLALAFAGAALANSLDAQKALPVGLHTAPSMQMIQTAKSRRALSHQSSKRSVTSGTGQPVLNCLDDNSAGSLRNVVMGAASGDTIDLSGLTSCADSKITLLLGELTIAQADLTFTGPPLLPNGRPALTIDANQNGRAIDSPTGTLEINNLAIVNGKLNVDDGPAAGGCVYAYSDIAVTNSVVSNCTVSGSSVRGGGIYSYYGGVSVVSSTVSNNTALATATAAGIEATLQAVAGGVYSYATLTVTGSTISGNEANIGLPGAAMAATTFGGGLATSPRSTYNNTIVGSTVSGNSANFGGGAVAAGYLTVTQSTLSGNSSTAGGFSTTGALGGGSGAISGYFAYGITLQNSTIAFNTAAGYTGGVFAPGAGTLTIDSTIISNNTAGDTTYAADLGAYAAITVSGSNSLITSNDALIAFDNVPLTADPVLLPLADNGGPTQTHALDPTSPAIDAGSDPLLLINDQRGFGFPRWVGVAPDIGALESPFISDRLFANGFE